MGVMRLFYGLQKFVEQSGGHRGGWDEYDHGTFMKVRNKYKGRIVFLDHLKGMLLTKTEDEIREHETWYQEYLFLNERKKDIIKNWRTKREEVKEDLLSKARDGQDSEDKEDEKSKQRLQEIIDAEKKERFSKLNAWKVHKELEKAIQEERKMRKELAKVKKAEEERKRQAEVRVQVEEFRKQREQEEEFLRQQEELWRRQEEECRRQLSAREIVKFRTRDQQQLQQKLAKEAEKENALRAKEKQLES
ncbi:hypothetical protein C0Q70_20742 [Pomacea canaliculata]|uniref:Uncharacterized protein n=1 Tax=Pomacea canaliculata TaxID=400727 RepID=A0A2T7NGG3_POMCA|nr:hypothetical protein C0Q70_20742 [Pomacea canaliculata]